MEILHALLLLVGGVCAGFLAGFFGVGGGIVLVPILLFYYQAINVTSWNVPFYFGGTSLLIIVVVTMDFMSQVQAYIMSHQYESLLKKANFKGAGFPGR